MLRVHWVGGCGCMCVVRGARVVRGVWGVRGAWAWVVRGAWGVLWGVGVGCALRAGLMRCVRLVHARACSASWVVRIVCFVHVCVLSGWVVYDERARVQRVPPQQPSAGQHGACQAPLTRGGTEVLWAKAAAGGEHQGRGRGHVGAPGVCACGMSWQGHAYPHQSTSPAWPNRRARLDQPSRSGGPPGPWLTDPRADNARPDTEVRPVPAPQT